MKLKDKIITAFEEKFIRKSNFNPKASEFKISLGDGVVVEQALDFLSQSMDKVEAEARKEVGEQMFAWFYGHNNEMVEDAIARITGVGYGNEKEYKALHSTKGQDDK